LTRKNKILNLIKKALRLFKGSLDIESLRKIERIIWEAEESLGGKQSTAKNRFFLKAKEERENLTNEVFCKLQKKEHMSLPLIGFTLILI